jgi:hypothetical protein
MRRQASKLPAAGGVARSGDSRFPIERERESSVATARESPKERELSVDECARLYELRLRDVAPGRGDLERGTHLGGAACRDAKVMRAILPHSTIAFDNVEENRRPGATKLIGESAIARANAFDGPPKRLDELGSN